MPGGGALGDEGAGPGQGTSWVYDEATDSSGALANAAAPALRRWSRPEHNCPLGTAVVPCCPLLHAPDMLQGCLWAMNHFSPCPRRRPRWGREGHPATPGPAIEPLGLTAAAGTSPR